jgi:hypothetical protein
MIQRKQSLFFLQSIFLSAALLFLPVCSFQLYGIRNDVSLVLFEANGAMSSGLHQAAVLINFLTLALVSLIVFLYRRRELQVRLSMLSILLWLVLGTLLSFGQFVVAAEPVQTPVNWLAVFICLVAIVALVFAIRFIKKDINLLKSADRIR